MSYDESLAAVRVKNQKIHQRNVADGSEMIAVRDVRVGIQIEFLRITSNRIIIININRRSAIVGALDYIDLDDAIVCGWRSDC